MTSYYGQMRVCWVSYGVLQPIKSYEMVQPIKSMSESEKYLVKWLIVQSTHRLFLLWLLSSFPLMALVDAPPGDEERHSIIL